MQAENVGNLDDVLKLSLEKSEHCIKAAKILQGNEFFEDAVSRAYYGIFWAVETVHILNGQHIKTHKEAIGRFNRDYVHTEIFPKSFGEKLKKASKSRERCDYSTNLNTSAEDAEQILNFAEELFDAVKIYYEGRINGNEGKKF